LGGLAAARFALDVLAELESIDGLSLDEHGERPAFREVLEAPVVRLAGAETADGDWLDLAVEVTVGGEQVPFHELFVALVEGASELLLPSGTLFSLDRPELHRLVELIVEARALHDSPRATARLSRFQASLWEDLCQLGATGAEIGARAAAVAALAAAGDAAPAPLPEGLTATLRPYQVEGFEWLASRYPHGLGGILADDMGLGKTLQALALVCHARERGLSEAPFLVVAPTSVVPGWVAEAERFAPDVPVVAITQTSARRGVGLKEAIEGAGVVVTSYALLRIDHDDYAGLAWAGLFLDEAQFVKNPVTKAHRCARQIAAPFKLALTGTPLENSLAELWALTSITAPGLFPRPDRFAEAYRTPIERHHDAERLGQLRRRIRPVLLRRRKEDVAADLPDKQEQVVQLELHPR
ncbi:MAG: DEAD/DEAH box helicase, partial [Acidimicrobiales bacterium]